MRGDLSTLRFLAPVRGERFASANEINGGLNVTR